MRNRWPIPLWAILDRGPGTGKTEFESLNWWLGHPGVTSLTPFLIRVLQIAINDTSTIASHPSHDFFFSSIFWIFFYDCIWTFGLINRLDREKYYFTILKDIFYISYIHIIDSPTHPCQKDGGFDYDPAYDRNSTVIWVQYCAKLLEECTWCVSSGPFFLAKRGVRA